MKTKGKFNLAVLLFTLFILPFGEAGKGFCQSIAINESGTSPNATAMLDVASTTAGFLIPCLSDAQRTVIPAPAQGLIIYNITTNYFNVYNTTVPVGWYELSSTSYIDNTYSGAAAQVIGVGFNASGNPPTASAICEINSSIKGLLIPRTTTGSITSPATGLCIYNTAANGISYYNGSSWITPCTQLIDNSIGGGSLANTAGIGISAGSVPPDDCAMLDIFSPSQGLLIPRMTDTDRRNLKSPSTGLAIYNTTSNLLNYWNGTGWYSFASTAPAQPGSITGTTPVCVNENGVAYSVTNVAGVTYSWTYSGGASQFTAASGQGTNAITANFSGTAASGTLTVTPGNACGNGTVQTMAIVVNPAPAISAQPGNSTICAGGSANFSVTATGTGLTYQWQYNSGTWNNVSDASPAGSTYSNQTTATLTVNGISGVGSYQYRCIVSGTCTPSVTSGTGTLTVNADPSISAQPSNATICTGGSYSPSVTVTGGVTITYQWQYSANGSSGWGNVVNSTPAGSTYTNATTATLTASGITGAGNYYYRCVVSDAGSGCTTPTNSNNGILTVNADPSISVQPSNATISAGGTYSPSVTVTGGVTITYQWQYSANGSSGWGNVVNSTPAGSTYTNETTATLTASGISGGGPYYYRCVVSDAGNGCTTPTNSNNGVLTIFSCGGTLAVSHTAGTLAPETKSVNYGTVTTSLTGSSKCWITQNLGSTNQASSATDATDASAGWYWQFNRMQGYLAGTTPAWTISSISETSDWLAANDPCTIELGSGWRIPTYTEWWNADSNAPWGNLTDTYNSVLKLHGAGLLNSWSSGALNDRGVKGNYWSTTQVSTTEGYYLHCNNDGSFNSFMYNQPKAMGYSVRCIKD